MSLNWVQGNPANDYSPGVISGSWAVGQSIHLVSFLGHEVSHLLPLFEVSASCLDIDFLVGWLFFYS